MYLPNSLITCTGTMLTMDVASAVTSASIFFFVFTVLLACLHQRVGMYCSWQCYWNILRRVERKARNIAAILFMELLVVGVGHFKWRRSEILGIWLLMRPGTRAQECGRAADDDVPP